MRTQLAFVGRERELASGMQAIDTARSGDGSLLLVSGNAGVGKTRLCGELVSAAAEGEFLVLSGQCREIPGAPAYWPWLQLLRGFDRLEGIEHELGRVQAALSSGSSGSGGSQLQHETSNLTEFRTHELTTDLLLEVSRDNPTLVLLEDIHWADHASLRLLEFMTPVLNTGRLLIAASFREQELDEVHPLRETLGELRRSAHAIDIQVGKFDAAEISSLVEVATGLPPADGLVDLLSERSDGNVLYATELIRLLDEARQLSDARLTESHVRELGVPRSISSTVIRRLANLPQETVETLRVAASVGREHDLGLTAEVIEIEPIEVLVRLEPAIRAGLLEELPGGHSQYRFTHALIWEAVLAEIPASLRMQLQIAAATAIEARGEDYARQNAGTLAYHYGIAEAVSGHEPVIKWSLLHGEQLIKNRAFEDGFEVFQQVLKRLAPGLHEILDDIPRSTGWPLEDISKLEAMTSSTVETARALKGYARCWMAAGYDLRGIIAGRIAFNIFAKHEMVSDCVEVAVLPIADDGGLKAYTTQLETAMGMVAEDTTEYGFVISKYMGQVADLPKFDIDGSRRLYDAALKIAEANGSIELEAWTHGRFGMVNVWHGQFTEGLRIVSRSIELGRLSDNYEVLGHCLFWAGFASACLGDMDGLKYYSGVLDYESERSRSNLRKMQAWQLRKTIWLLEGNVEIDDRLRARPDSDGPGAWIDYAARGSVLGEYGHLDEAIEIAHAFIKRNKEFNFPFHWPRIRASPWIARIGYLTNDQDLMDYAVVDVEYAPGKFEQPAMHEIGFQIARAHRAQTINSPELAKRPFDYLRPFTGLLNACVWSFPNAIDRVLGILANMLGMEDQAEAYFVSALKLCESSGLRPEHAWSAYDYATFLINHDRAVEAGQLIETGLAIANDCGLIPLKQRLETVQKKLAGEPPQILTPGGLTTREVEVLDLVAKGRSNREIADALFISQNTVIRHVSNIFAKTGCANRAEAAIWFERNVARPQGSD